VPNQKKKIPESFCPSLHSVSDPPQPMDGFPLRKPEFRNRDPRAIMNGSINASVPLFFPSRSRSLSALFRRRAPSSVSSLQFTPIEPFSSRPLPPRILAKIGAILIDQDGCPRFMFFFFLPASTPFFFFAGSYFLCLTIYSERPPPIPSPGIFLGRDNSFFPPFPSGGVTSRS